MLYIVAIVGYKIIYICFYFGQNYKFTSQTRVSNT